MAALCNTMVSSEESAPTIWLEIQYDCAILAFVVHFKTQTQYSMCRQSNQHQYTLHNQVQKGKELQHESKS